MILRKLILFITFLLLCATAAAQYTGNSRSKALKAPADTLFLDSLSLVPGSIELRTKDGQLLDTSFFKVRHAEGIVLLDRKKMEAAQINADSLSASYKVFPYLFSAETRHKDPGKVRPDLSGHSNPFSYTIENKNEDIFKMDGLNKSGSISRGITFGNNQDVVVNSNLNLQLSGHLSNNIDILLAATDNNIPIQPEGNTQQLQEFDKVFIQLSNANTKLIAGDFQLLRPPSYFMNFNKKAQGISFSTALVTNKEEKDLLKHGLYKTSLSAAVSRGKFARNQIQGVESNQGPYRLRGAENEPFIIILSGTEKVYIDGRLMDRGQENDYIIDYNTGEVTFTARQLITKDKRIVVEFQYSDKNYARSLVHFGNEFTQNKLRLHLNVYSEQDSKNQPLQQDLTADQKRLLARIGDTLSLAVSPSFDSVAFNTSEVLYHRRDTIIGSQAFNDVFVYSTNSDSAHYRVTFSNVGQGFGNYKQISSSANGKVFQWVMPDTISGRRNGNYEPVIQLITPKQKQMVTAGLDYAFSKNTMLSVEGAFSNNDINTFSPANGNDDEGYGLKMNFTNAQPIRGKGKTDTTQTPFVLSTNVNYEYLQKNFSPIERFRSIEFERDWNRGTTAIAADQHIAGAGAGISKKGLGSLGYRFNAFLEGDKYTGNKHFANLNVSRNGLTLLYDGSLLNSESTTNTAFYRHKSGISQKIKWLTLGLKDEFEDNRFALENRDSLLPNSYRFWEWQAYAQNSDTTKNRYGINYKQRSDHAIRNISGNTSFNRAAFAESYGAYLELISNPNNQLKINGAYRRLSVDSSLTFQKPDNSLVARVEYNVRALKGLIYSSTFYEIGSGLEVKKEFSFIEVAPGQGVYYYNGDYNNNGVKDLDEFEIAQFSDQATYIKIYTPTNDYIKTYSNQFSQTLMLKPAAIWQSKNGFRKFLSRFANQSSYRVDRKSTEDDLSRAYNPFLAETEDSTLATLNSSFRNTLFINQMSPVLGMEMTYQDVRNKSLLVNGFDSRANIFKELKLRWNITPQFNWNLSYRDGRKINTSQFFSTRNYNIIYYEAEPKFSYQPNTSFRTTISFKYTDKKNKNELGGQKAVLQDFGAEIKYNVLQKGSLNLRANYILIKFNGTQNTSLAFEMLDALKTGRNITWGLTYQRTLSNNLQLSITYDGRQSEGSKAIHTGGAQVRAYF